MLHLILIFAAVGAACAQPSSKPGRKYTTLERMQPERLETVRQARERFARQRRDLPQVSLYSDYRAVVHVHAEDADHTKGTRAEVLKAAKENGVKVVLLTDHRGPKPDTWHGVRDGVLFLAGSEDERRIRFPGTPELRFLSHLEEQPDMPSAGFHGTEIYNRHSDALDEPEFNTWLKGNGGAAADLFKRYPDEVFNAGTDSMPVFTGRWDAETATMRVFTGVAANDSHQNQVFGGTMLDPYAVSFRSVSTHILARELTDKAIRASLAAGHVYVSHDWLADPTGFAFVASNNLGVFDMGDRIPLTGTTRLNAQLPLPAKLKLLLNGALVSETTGDRLQYVAKEPGAYRLEAWLEVDGEERPWIYSNPIFVTKADLSTMKLPSNEISANVEVARDIPYLQDDLPKHKLDVYRPKDRSGSVPVLVFLHGGAWRTGDRSLYTALGNRFASEGLVTVVPSYRLLPAAAWPSQVEDAAAALAWTAKHAGTYGGDPKRIYVAGHSAGGHLAALLALDPQWLRRHGASPAVLSGVIPMSGVYEVHGLSTVFGSDGAVRRQASPMEHVRQDAPPFLITYCQWDYLGLPAQAERFHAELRNQGVLSQTVFVPKQSHISEMLNITAPDDATVRAVLSFIK